MTKDLKDIVFNTKIYSQQEVDTLLKNKSVYVNFEKPNSSNNIFLNKLICDDSGKVYKTRILNLPGENWIVSNTFESKVKCFCHNDRIIVVGTENNGILYTETNGDTWIETNITDKTINVIKYYNGKFLAGTQSGLYYSIDGKNWLQTKQTTSNVISLLGTINYWIAGTDRNGLLFSDDGITWKTTNVKYISINTLYSNNAYIFAGTNSNGVLISSDGKNWEQTDLNDVSITQITSINNCIVCGTKTNGILYSKNGLKWNQSNIKSTEITGIETNGTITIAVAGNKLFGTIDGIYWSELYVDSAGKLNNIIYGNNVWVASKSSKGYIISNNGLDWDIVPGTTTYSSNVLYSANDIFFGNILSELTSGIANGIVYSKFEEERKALVSEDELDEINRFPILYPTPLSQDNTTETLSSYIKYSDLSSILSPYAKKNSVASTYVSKTYLSNILPSYVDTRLSDTVQTIFDTKTGTDIKLINTDSPYTLTDVANILNNLLSSVFGINTYIN